MLNANDLEQLKAKGISEKQIEEQLACFVKGFPFLEIAASASVEKGIYKSCIAVHQVDDVGMVKRNRLLIWMLGTLIWLKTRKS